MAVSSRQRIGVLALVVMAVGLVTWLSPKARRATPPAPEREVTSKELTRRDDRMYLAAETEPFTGVLVERYSTGELKARSRMKQGRLDGVSEGWHTNGVRQISEHFDAGVSHGVRTKWFSDGRKLSEAGIDQGKLSGQFRRWHENGVLAEEIQMSNNLPDGLSRLYYPSGALKAEARTAQGKVLEQHRWKDGESPASVDASRPL